MRILFFGTPDFATPCIRALHEAGHEVIGAVTQPDKPQGRSMKLCAPPVKEYALGVGIPVFQPERLREGQFDATLRELDPELCVVVAYGKILPPSIISYPKYGCVNVHGSLLPRWRGAAPIQWAVLAGDRTTGVCTMYMDEGLDTGDVILRAETEIGETETAGELFDRLKIMGAQLLLQTVDLIAKDQAPRTPQGDDCSCYAKMLNRDMSDIDWSRPACEICCQVRGLNPWPVACARLEGVPLKIFTVSVNQREGVHAPAGTVLSADSDGISVACGSGVLTVLELQAQGGRRMSAASYLNGHPIPAGTRFEVSH